MTLVIGLTGGIGSGKTTVANLFAAKKINVIDTDELAREVVMINSEGYRQIIEHFGHDILGNDQQINRAALREKIFSDTKARQWLEALLHPLILDLMRTRINEVTSSYCIVVIPLLIETHCKKNVDRILVVDVEPQIQIARVQQRDGLNITQVQSILEAQATRENRLNAADDILCNAGDIALLEVEVEKLHQQYLRLALDRIRK